MVLGLVIGFIGLLETITTINYITTANSLTFRFTIAHTKSSQFAVSSPVIGW
jgi:hypothetical protein